ncbi:MAG TPA: NHL repeat-containing protein [Candidatus Sulfotelmatobacter sp.]|nr:NHL repeat-containing protein [Candidatus Sulfotelmatobacter sp.]
MSHFRRALSTAPLVAVFAFGAAGCGGSGAVSPATHAATPTEKTGTARFVIDGAVAGVTQGSSRRPRYISPATQSITINVTDQGSSTSVSGYPQTANLTPTSSGCSSTLASTQCTLTLTLGPGDYDATFTTYDQPNGAGNQLSAAQNVPFSIVAGTTNTITLTIGGIPTSVRIIADSPTTIAGDPVNGFTLPTGDNGYVTVLGVDADGNYVLGVGAPTVALSSSDTTSYTVTASGSSAPNRFLLTNAAPYAGAALLTATVTPSAQSGASTLTMQAHVFSQPSVIYVEEVEVDAVLGFSPFGTLEVSSGFTGTGGPSAAVFDPANGFIYVTNAANSTITVYTANGTKQTLSGSFPNLSTPEGIVYDPTNGYLYVANEGNSTITVYDANGNQQTPSGTFAGLNEPHGLLYDPANGFIYVTNVLGNTVTAYDMNGNQQTLSGTFSGLDSPDGIAYDTVTGWLYVTNFSNGTVTVYDQNGNRQTVAGSFSGLNHPDAITYDLANGVLYVASSSNGTVAAFTDTGTASTKLGASFETSSPPQGVAVLP